MYRIQIQIAVHCNITAWSDKLRPTVKVIKAKIKMQCPEYSENVETTMSFSRITLISYGIYIVLDWRRYFKKYKYNNQEINTAYFILFDLI